jgi:hypothetical protein
LYKTLWIRGAGGAIAAFLAGAASAGDGVGGGLTGFVEDTRGTPVPGAVISVYGKGIRGGGLVTFSDDRGHFVLPSLPAGSYTLRALGRGHAPAPARKVTVLPNHESIFSVSLTPLADAATVDREAADSEGLRELRWLLRHKRRSALEGRGHAHAAAVAENEPRRDASGVWEAAAPWFGNLSGTVEVFTTPEALLASDSPRDDSPAGVGIVRLKGRLANVARWSLSGLLTETDSTAWRMASEFAVETGGGHEFRVGSGYGTGLLQPLLPTQADGQTDNRSVGAIFVEDRIRLGQRLTTSVGARYSYIGFLESKNHLDPTASFEYTTSGLARLRGTLSSRTVTPGGDLLTLTTLATPAMALALLDDGIEPERILRYELAVDHTEGPVTVGAHVFRESVKDPLVNAFEGPASGRRLRIVNGRSLTAQGVGLSFGRRFGDVVQGSLTYTYGRSQAGESRRPAYRGLPSLAYDTADFHDVVARIEAFIAWSDTRVSALYRINALNPMGDIEGTRHLRFGIQLSQGLPLLSSLTRAQWDVLVSFRNLFYEGSEAGTLDELSVIHPPKRITGGIAVRF